MSADDSLNAHAASSDGNKLVGWKDIAAYLGKGLRTAQRWEKEFGLPVRRVGRDGGEIVFAFRAEIDAWLRREDGLRARRADQGSNGENGHAERPTQSADLVHATQGAHAVASPAVTVVSPPRVTPRAGANNEQARPRLRPGPRLALWAAAAVILVGGAVITWWAVRPAGPANPSAWRVSGRTFSTLDARGRYLWSHEFDRPLYEALYRRWPADLWGFRGSVLIADLDADGADEVVLRRYDDLREHRQFFVFNADGTVRFVRRVGQSRRFGDALYSPPWLAHATMLTDNGAGPPTLWLVHVETQDFPTLLEAVDAQGQPRSEYWSNGYIEVVKAASVGGRDLVFVGGANNDTGGAALAVFEKGHVNGAAPAERPAYRCANCPPGQPLAFLVFPRLCMLRAKHQQATVQEVSVAESGQVTVNVRQDSVGSPSVYYRLDPALRLVSVEVSAGYREIHRAQERSGVLDHSYSATEEEEARKVLRWDGTRFVDVEWAPGVAVAPPADPSRDD